MNKNSSVGFNNLTHSSNLVQIGLSGRRLLSYPLAFSLCIRAFVYR